ncbi:MAG: SDR family NAD(P)-dependent oxidoreductase [Clostridiales bacterium]|jgi:NAD(P)-dependent dehydrogenase (short-subunit alcohol dehydrogenase family)|nr:SDR family NAD(P)-dependent oxidoreductase [Clostridiales bacterium]
MNKIIVISGGSSGIGAAVREKFMRAGDTVISLSRSNTAQDMNHIPCDVTREADVAAAAEIIRAKFGRVDVLINNAGFGIIGATEMLPLVSVAAVMDVNYTGAFLLSKACVPLMRRGSKIVNISSVCALFSVPYRGVYCSAKAAQSMLSFSMRTELKKSGIAVVCVCPGEIDTPFPKNRIIVTDTNGRYGDAPQKDAERIEKRAKKRMPLAYAASKIFKIADRKSGALYIIGKKYKFFYFAQKILPFSWFFAIAEKAFQ